MMNKNVLSVFYAIVLVVAALVGETISVAASTAHPAAEPDDMEACFAQCRADFAYCVDVNEGKCAQKFYQCYRACARASATTECAP